MADDFTETTTTGWFERLKNAVVGIFVGGALFVASFFLLFWNEGRAVKTAQSLTEGAGAVVSVSPDKVDPANQGRLVHMTGQASTTDTLADPVFGVTASSLRLRRRVQTFQWEETKETHTQKNVGGSQTTQTEYHYRKAWADHPIVSSSFHETAGHENPSGGLPYAADDWAAPKATVGAFTLSPSLLRQLSTFEPLAITPELAQKLPAAFAGKLKPAEGGYYQGAEPANPQIGDAKISFEVVPAQSVSIVSRQLGASFEPYATKAGRDIDMIQTGAHAADSMFKAAMESNNLLSWILRLVGFLLMFFGLMLVFEPLVILADVLPFLGWIVGAGRTMFCFAVAAALSLITIAVAWIAYRPLLGGALLVAGVLVLVKGLSSRRAASAPAAAA